MHLYKDQFSESHNFPSVDKPSKVLIIASTGRCGSHMLGHALYKTGSFGFPLEYANPVNLTEWKKRLNEEDLEGVLTKIQKRRTSPNGVFGIKIHYSHLEQFGGFTKLVEFFPNAYYIHLYRKDVLRQAISMSLAKQTGVWISGQKPIDNNPKYNFEDINENLRQIILDNSSWQYVLSGSGSNYIEMSFNSVLNNLVPSIEKIADFMDVKVNRDSIPDEHVTEKQANGIKSLWEKKFTSEFTPSNELRSVKKIDFYNRFKNEIKRMIQNNFKS